MNKYSSIVLLLIILICFGCSNSKDKKTGKSPETITVEQVKEIVSKICFLNKENIAYIRSTMDMYNQDYIGYVMTHGIGTEDIYYYYYATNKIKLIDVENLIIHTDQIESLDIEETISCDITVAKDNVTKYGKDHEKDVSPKKPIKFEVYLLKTKDKGWIVSNMIPFKSNNEYIQFYNIDSVSENKDINPKDKYLDIYSTKEYSFYQIACK